mmetsp:Transcript_21618/g.42463  ORF Transcript_21618/g.42463 Transcript_21618/m.42463 type:complete len:243 (-) Transcript_21618:28-756(-)
MARLLAVVLGDFRDLVEALDVGSELGELVEASSGNVVNEATLELVKVGHSVAISNSGALSGSEKDAAVGLDEVLDELGVLGQLGLKPLLAELLDLGLALLGLNEFLGVAKLLRSHAEAVSRHPGASKVIDEVDGLVDLELLHGVRRHELASAHGTGKAEEGITLGEHGAIVDLHQRQLAELGLRLDGSPLFVVHAVVLELNAIEGEGEADLLRDTLDVEVGELDRHGSWLLVYLFACLLFSF